jgi:N-carbamoyl-L-amino-acid hydrolase
VIAAAELRDRLAGLEPIGPDADRTSHSAGTAFDPAVRAALGRLPEVACFAGRDAGIVGERLPVGMVLVRNPTGVGHSPEESVDLEDAATGARAVLSAMEALA